MKNKGLRITLLIIVLIVIAILAGPKMPKPKLSAELPDIQLKVGDVEGFIQNKESQLSIRPGNNSRIYWANDTLKDQTEYALLYLHGFSASPMEGDPVHQDIARKFGMNAYIPLLWDHGLITEDALLDMTPDKLWDSAKEALVVAHALGKKVVIMGTSTGGTLALQMAADYPDLIDALVLYSPNVRVANKAIFIVARPWGLQIGRMIMGGDYRVVENTEDEAKFWYSKYRVEGLLYLQQLVEKTMKSSVFEQVTIPVFTGYYYKDDDNQDQTVSVEAIKWMFDNLGTDPDLKVSEAFPDAGAHVIGCSLTNLNYQNVENATVKFLQEKLGLVPVE